MPYKDPNAKRDWEREHRKDAGDVFLNAAKWADGQIELLRSMGIEHSKEDWKALRNDLIKSRLTLSTIASLRHTATP